MKRSRLAGVLAAACALICAAPASAAVVTDVITEGDVVRQAEGTTPTNDWVVYTRTANSVATFVTGPSTPPVGDGSLETSTPATGDKVFAFNYDWIGTPLTDLDAISYSSYRGTALPAQPLPSLNIEIDENGGTLQPGDYAVLVFEPINNTGLQGVIVPGLWQTWNGINSGTARWWTSQPINGQCNGPSAACLRTWSQVLANNPNATIIGGFGINQGSGNPGLTGASDGLTVGTVGADDVRYDFEPDDDGDGVANVSDNCPDDANADQADGDGDAIGDVCDPDRDNDGVANGTDNCPDASNAGQEDADGDLIGDACDPDRDGDGVANGTDNCADTPNADQADHDGDGIGTACDGTELPVTPDDCKQDNWKVWTPPFKNQGDCVSSLNKP